MLGICLRVEGLRPLAEPIRWGVVAALLLSGAASPTIRIDASTAMVSAPASAPVATPEGPPAGAPSAGARAFEGGEDDLPHTWADAPVGGRLPLLTADVPYLRTIRLSDEDTRRYRHIFELQAGAAWDDADLEIAKLHDRRLVGHVLRQRYLHPGYSKVTYADLRAWLKRYGDQAGAARIYALAAARQPHGEPPPPDIPDIQRQAGALEERAPKGETGVAPRSRAVYSGVLPGPIGDRIDGFLREGKLGAAIRVLGDDVLTRKLDSAEYDSLRARIAAALLYNGSPRGAFVLASASAARSGDAVPLAHWIAGLAAWRQGNVAAAGRHFTAMAANASLSAGDSAAASYWAARAEAREGRDEEAKRWLARAARYDRTFYGLIAGRSLGQAPGFHWQVPVLTARHLAALAETAPGHRAIALLQIGQDDLAEQELLRIHSGGNAVLAEALVAVSDQGGLPALALQIGNAVAAPDGNTYDAALYPLPHWAPPEGFTLDRALVFAIMRQESRFETRLISRAGATGLMQIMPETARDMGVFQGGAALRVAEDRRDDQAVERRLFDPQWNLQLGQRYVVSLLTSPPVAGNLFHLAAAYNAGPSNLVRWRHELDEINDPLLFVESVPMHETRDYIHKVLANLWIYQMRLGQPVTTLDAVAAGAWPVYQVPGTQVAVREE